VLVLTQVAEHRLQGGETAGDHRSANLAVEALETAKRIGHNKAAVALANKLVRICWAAWCHERRFCGDWKSAKPARRRGKLVRGDGFLVVVVSSSTDGTGESCSGTRPIVMLIRKIS
jgi:hypothetical protein